MLLVPVPQPRGLALEAEAYRAPPLNGVFPQRRQASAAARG
jgi:hypothetical protein